MAYLLKELDKSLHLGPLDNYILTYLITLGDSLKEIEQFKGVLNERVKFELALANTFAGYLEKILNTAWMEIPEEYTKNYKSLKSRLEFLNLWYNPLLTASK